MPKKKEIFDLLAIFLATLGVILGMVFMAWLRGTISVNYEVPEIIWFLITGALSAIIILAVQDYRGVDELKLVTWFISFIVATVIIGFLYVMFNYLGQVGFTIPEIISYPIVAILTTLGVMAAEKARG